MKIRPNLSAQAQKFQIFEKKLSLGVRSPWSDLSHPSLRFLYIFDDPGLLCGARTTGLHATGAPTVTPRSTAVHCTVTDGFGIKRGLVSSGFAGFARRLATSRTLPRAAGRATSAAASPMSHI